ncbi:hypothetical protein [Arcobacter sp. LA11]|uniref:hypothetical protein n=1 Tax=Arcobacter sp. LA11 TaxID=1898176 RepID=UPI000934E922|nr:hypothetical protein [Arcobacter sp. LA11]
MIALSLVNTTANIIVSSITTKIFDSVVTSKLTQKQEKKKWIRDKKLNLFSQLSENILTINCDNLLEKKLLIKELASKIMLLTEDENLKTNLVNYTFILDEYECYKSDINLNHLNDELISTLCTYMKKL